MSRITDVLGAASSALSLLDRLALRRQQHLTPAARRDLCIAAAHQLERKIPRVRRRNPKRAEYLAGQAALLFGQAERWASLAACTP